MTPYQKSKILDAGDLLILSNLQKPWTIACKDISRVFEIEYSTYHILNRSELCKCSLTAGNYLLSYTNINCGNAPEARDGYFTTYYSFNMTILDVITKKFDIQVDKNTKTQAALLHDDIPGYDLPTIDFVQTTTDNDEDVSISEKDNSQIYAHLDNVLVHMIDNQEAAIFKSNQDFNKNKEKISQYIKYAENWQIASVICSYTAMVCDVLLIIAMIVFLLKYHKTMQVMLTAFLQMNTKNTGIQSVQADQISRTYSIVHMSRCKDLFVEVTNVTKGNKIWAHFVSTRYFPSQIQLSRPIQKDDVQTRNCLLYI